jgi:hypothetical protein
VEVGAWNTAGKAGITGKAKTGDELWTVPGGHPGAGQSKFTSSKTELSLVESQVATQAHADMVAKAALTRRAMEFLTAEVEVQGNPAVKPGAMVNLKKVGQYSGHYYVTEANHFYDAGGYTVIFYVARDKWGDSSNEKKKEKQDDQNQPGPSRRTTRTRRTSSTSRCRTTRARRSPTYRSRFTSPAARRWRRPPTAAATSISTRSRRGRTRWRSSAPARRSPSSTSRSRTPRATRSRAPRARSS